LGKLPRHAFEEEMTDRSMVQTPPPPQSPAGPPPPRRSPRNYRPDLRPMLILGGLLLAVIVGWILISPLLLPAAR
jgi:hypothetical protein